MNKRNNKIDKSMFALLYAGKDPLFEFGRKRAIEEFKSRKTLASDSSMAFMKKNYSEEYIEGYLQTVAMLEFHKAMLEMDYPPLADDEILSLLLESWDMPDESAALLGEVSLAEFQQFLSGKKKIPETIWKHFVIHEALVFKYHGEKLREDAMRRWAQYRYLELRQEKPRPKSRKSQKHSEPGKEL